MSLNSDMLVNLYWVFSMKMYYLLVDMEAALCFGRKFWKSKGLPGAFAYSVPFFSALAALEDVQKLAFIEGIPQIPRPGVFVGVDWTPKRSTLGPSAGCIASDTQRWEEVKRGFERSISTVFCEGFLHHATLANELAGKFISNSNEKCYYLSQAKHHYPTWGAKAVTRKLNLLLREVADDNSKNGVIDLGPERARETAPNKGKSAVSEGKDAAADPLSAGV
eukprot:scaffold1697_cov180-Amphora_coffeaeformis.AAC.33